MRPPKVNAWYGWVPDRPDYRDKLFSSIAAPPKKLPNKVDLRRNCSGVEDQGQLGSCTANALVGNLEFLECLAEGYPLVFGFSVYEAFEGDEVARTGKLNLPEPSEKQLGGHAVMAVGYDDSAERVLVRNSRGTDWGMKGYFTMPYDYISNDNLADDLWTLRGIENA